MHSQNRAVNGCGDAGNSPLKGFEKETKTEEPLEAEEGSNHDHDIKVYSRNIVHDAILDAAEELASEFPPPDGASESENEPETKSKAKQKPKPRTKPTSTKAKNPGFFQKCCTWLNAEYGSDIDHKSGVKLNVAMKKANLACPSAMVLSKAYKDRCDNRQKKYERMLEEWKFNQSIGVHKEMPKLEDIPLYPRWIERMAEYNIEGMLVGLLVFVLLVCYPVVFWHAKQSQTANGQSPANPNPTKTEL